MKAKLNPYIAHPELTKLLIDFASKLAQSGIEPTIQELLKIRASQLNGCAVCLHMHTRDARRQGMSEERIYLLDAWRESPLYNDRERAALAWTDALTRIGDHTTMDEAYELVQAQFTPEEQVKLNLMIGTINAFNRVAVGFRLSHPVEAKRQAA